MRVPSRDKSGAVPFVIFLGLVPSAFAIQIAPDRSKASCCCAEAAVGVDRMRNEKERRARDQTETVGDSRIQRQARSASYVDGADNSSGVQSARQSRRQGGPPPFVGRLISLSLLR